MPDPRKFDKNATVRHRRYRTFALVRFLFCVDPPLAEVSPSHQRSGRPVIGHVLFLIGLTRYRDPRQLWPGGPEERKKDEGRIKK